MRRRLIRSTLAIALVALVALGVPLLLLARQEVWSSAKDALQQQAASVAAGLEDRLDAGQPVSLDRYADAMPDRRIVVVATDGTTTAEGPELRGDVLRATVRVSDARVTVEEARSATVTRVREVTLLVLALMLLAVGAAVWLAVRQARRLSAPLADLAERADSLGRGDFALAPIDSGIPEIDGISRVLERSAQEVGTYVELQREFAGDAAHQLRTPLTGIGLRLEELARIGDPDVAQEAQDALAQVERLDAVITSLLARARNDTAERELVDVTAVVAAEAPTWSRALDEVDRRLVINADPGLVVLARRAHVVGVLACVFDNALHHGAGEVRVSASRVGREIEVVVEDDGPGVPPELAAHIFDRRVSGSHGTGIGLALARSLAGAEDGRLELVAPGSSTFLLRLPVASS
jgi:signal transduction histidine kinase